ncbi:MAG: 5-bromo-4-chloroindolyl phosphate hydrolysis family protein [Clostridia bacterium]|nr:5-bromo-4-chloroindolyl phosphate hydrolysis family protein [Clostridia bacterium]
MDNKNSGKSGLISLIVFALIIFVSVKLLPDLAKVLLIVLGIVVVLIVVLIVLIIVFSVKKPKEKGNKSDNASMLDNGRAVLLELRKLTMRVKNYQVRSKSNEICTVTGKILSTVKNQPENISDVRQFLNYYLPTIEKILRKYIMLEESGVPADEVINNTASCLSEIKVALDRQYENLFEDDKLDLSVEMETLKIACKRDGLLVDEDFNFQKGDNNNPLEL